MMPQKPAVLMPGIPLFLITSVVGRIVRKAGDELVRIVVRK